MTFTTKDQVTMHVEAKHPKYLKCTLCDSSFRSYLKRQQHMAKEHPFSGICPTPGCEKKFEFRHQLKWHISEKHSKKRAEKPGFFICAVCGKTFKKKIHLNAHEEHHNPNPVECDICFQTYPGVISLDDHKRRHQMSQIVACCEVCGKQFSQSYMNRHMKTHLPGQKEKKFQCHVCRRCFAVNDTLKAHMKLHENARKYECDECGKRFNLRGRIVSHIYSHLQGKFRCDICDMMFNRKSQVMAHMRLHKPKGRLFECKACGQPFFKKKEMEEHFKRCAI